MQFRPDPCARLKREQVHRLAAVTEREYEQPGAAVLAGSRVSHHGAGAVVDLRFFTWFCDYDRAGLRTERPAQLADEALYALIARSKAIIVNQVLVDGLAMAAFAEGEFDEIEEGLEGARCQASHGLDNRCRVGGHLVGRFCRWAASPRAR